MIVDLPGITLVGTAHVGKESVELVRSTIQARRPVAVAVELDDARYRALTDRRRFEETPLVEVIRSGKAPMLLAQAFLASYQRRLGEEAGSAPGMEMVAAIEEARTIGADVVLADRDLGVTLRRAWARMGVVEKTRLFWESTKAVMGAEEQAVASVKELLKEDVLSSMMKDLARIAPRGSEVLISERDAYLARNILSAAEKGPVVAVVGAGHIEGIRRHLERPAEVPDTAPFEVVPRSRFPVGAVLGWGLVLVILGVLAYLGYEGYVSGDFDRLRAALGTYVVATGGLAALGCLAALGHPLSILTAFVAAPITVIHPALAAGWFSGYVEAVVRKPTVKDFESLARVERLADFYRNQVLRILLVTALTNIGAMVGAYVAAGALLGELL
ncbi:MAG: TraB/GumN family protein [Methanobacteriota archaeon]